MDTSTFNPYVGLRPFKEDENLLFFGRDKQTLELLQRLHRHRFVAVVGGSGSGKSSLIRAGLIPALKGGYLVEDSSKWLISIMKPGSNPMFNLALAILKQVNPKATNDDVRDLVRKLKREGTSAILNLIRPLRQEKNANFFLLVDQFEELFRFSMKQKDAEKQAQAIDFVNLILNLSKQKILPFYIVLTMRSDFIGDCAQFRNLPEAMNESQFLVPRITRQDLKKIIEGPARLYGKKVEPLLTVKIINDLGKVEDELPLLQHAMMRIWDYETQINKSGALDLEDYRQIGGIEQALSQHADEALSGMSQEELDIARELFQALTAIDENGRKIRRPLLLSDLRKLTGEDEKRLLTIIDNFIRDRRSFLIVQDTGNNDKLIDISHESLIRQWYILGLWVDAENRSAINYLRLVKANELFRLQEKDYLTGTELAGAVAWKEEFQPTAVWAERYQDGFVEAMGYLNKSEEERNRLLGVERSRRRKFRVLIVAIMGLILLFGIYATSSNVSMRKQKDVIEAAKQKASNQNKALEIHFQAKKLEDKNPTVALRLEAEALKRYDYVEFETSAISLINRRSFYKIFASDSLAISDIDISSSGNVVAGHEYGYISIWNDEGILLSKFQSDSTYIYSVLFAENDESVLTANYDGDIRLWDLNGNLKREFKGHTKQVTSLALAPNGKDFISGSMDNTLRLWDLNGDIIQVFKGHGDKVQAVTFSPDGRSILSGSFDKTIRLWDMNGNQKFKIDGRGRELYSLAFAPDGKSFYSGSWDSNARAWDLRGELIRDFGGHWGTIFSIDVASDGNSILTGSFDNTMRLWDTKGRLLKEFLGHEGQVNVVKFSPDGRNVLSGSRDGTIRSWSLEGSIKAVFENHKHAVRSVTFAPDGKSVLTGSHENTQQWDLDGNLIRSWDSSTFGMTYSAVFSPDGQTILTGVAQKTAFLWDMEGHKIAEFNGHTDTVRSVAFAPNGKTVITSSWDGWVRHWDLKGNEIDAIYTGKGVGAVAFAPDSRSVVAGTFGEAVLWDFEQKELIKINHPSEVSVNAVVFSPNGRQVLTGSNDDVARLWDRKGKLIQEFKGPRGAVRSVAFSPDGSTVLIGAAGGSARLWDLEGNIIAEFKGNNRTVFSVAYAPDGKSIMMGSGTTAYLMRVIQLDEVLNSAIEELSTAQRREYGVDE